MQESKPMSNILNQIRKLEGLSPQSENVTKLPTRINVPSLRGMIVLDPNLDPDPWNLHNIPVSDRLKAMGWI